jgi:purine-binding chemotaxis protein CheW
MMPVIPVPDMPDFIKGVINLRGKVIPVADIRLKFGMPVADYTDQTCIIVTELSSESKKKAVIGIIVDCVSEVLNIKGTDIEDSPALLRSDRIGDRSVSDRNTDYILGIAKTKEDIVVQFWFFVEYFLHICYIPFEF